jgi:hypothetical protein
VFLLANVALLKMQLGTRVIFVILLCGTSVFAQDQQCRLKLSELPDVPELFGFRMGMSTERIKARVPQITFGRVNALGLSKTTINPDFEPRIDKSTFTGVRTISLDFLDGRTTSLWFGYDSSFKWHTVTQFVDQISKSLRLPAAWRPWKTGGQQISCADFQMTVSYLAEGPSFHIIDTSAAETLAARREEIEEQNERNEATAAAGVTANRKTKTYYPAQCPPANEIKETDLVVFNSKEEAENAGYKLVAECRAPTEP